MKTVAIVGNAPYLEGKGWGKEIDNHDIVVRINLNDLLIKKHGKDIGYKTDVAYLCRSLQRNKTYNNYSGWSDGIAYEFVKPNKTIRNKRRGYVCNTGLSAIVDYCERGYAVTVYGFDFYSGAFNGVIPQPILTTTRKRKVLKHLIYISGYTELSGNHCKYFYLGHVGGINDATHLHEYSKCYPITYDSVLQKIMTDNFGSKN